MIDWYLVCLAKLHEPLAKHEKNLVSAAELPRPNSSNDRSDSGTDQL